MRKRATFALASASALSFAAPAVAAPGTATNGPTTNVAPYVVPVAEGVDTTSLLTVGDKPASNGYKMVGIPDGLGVRRARGGAVELFMTHELRGTQGIARRHGQAGSFVSNYKINPRTLAVEEGKDLIGPSQTNFYDYPSRTFGALASKPGVAPNGEAFMGQSQAFQRFCSATLTDRNALINPATGNGFRGQIFFGNEESGDESRVFGSLDDGTTKQLPRLGLFSWENTVPAPNRTDTTLVQGQEDAALGQIWTYIGKKQRAGDAFDKAGLTSGENHVFDVVDEAISDDAQFRAKYGKNTPAAVDLSDVGWEQSGAKQNAEGRAEGLTLNRIEDGHWDPKNRNDFYFLTTEGGDKTPAPGTTNSRDGGGLWRLSYKDIENPKLGATLTLLLDGTEEPFLNKPDNMVIDTKGNLLIQEDPGNNASVARIVAYEIESGRLGVVAQFDPALFGAAAGGTAAPAPRTLDEESSGIVDGKGTFGPGTFVFDAQVHRPRPEAELVEEGQLLLLEVDDFDEVYGEDEDVDEDDERDGDDD